MDFYKYQGTGNDFILIDNRDQSFPKEQPIIEHLCDRRFGVGGDGLILLEEDEASDFRMVYYNSDGNESTMCGNGGRCIVAFAHHLKIFDNHTTFEAIDGLHEAEIFENTVKLRMIDVPEISRDDSNFVLNTGSPHFVQYVSDLKNLDVYKDGYSIRNSETYKKEGINVNFVEKIGLSDLFVRTYERGVEDETFSCGTGVTAAALSYMTEENLNEVSIQVLGGQLKVYAEKNGTGFHNIWLEGPADQVFKGTIKL